MAEHPPRADGVGQHPADHAALGGPDECPPHPPANQVVLDDVKQEVHVVLRGIDVGDQAIDDLFGLRHQRDGVADDYRQPAAVLRQLDQQTEAIGRVGIDQVHRIDRRRLGGVPQRPPLPPPGQPQPAQAIFADQQVKPQPDKRLEEDNRQPRQAGDRLFLAQHDHRQHRQADRPFACRQQRPEVQVHGLRWRGSSGGIGGEGRLISGGGSGARRGRLPAGVRICLYRSPAWRCYRCYRCGPFPPASRDTSPHTRQMPPQPLPAKAICRSYCNYLISAAQ